MMDTLIVYFDETQHAVQVLTPMRWIFVACTPRVTRHASK